MKYFLDKDSKISPLLFQIGQSFVLFWTVKYKSVCIYIIENWHKFLISLTAPAVLFLQEQPPARILEVGHRLTSLFIKDSKLRDLKKLANTIQFINFSTNQFINGDCSKNPNCHYEQRKNLMVFLFKSKKRDPSAYSFSMIR
ncbi:hypothetical protein SULYE_1583 [Sulfurihydrogenibium yellowstonense SS-5]|uniref:Uncharacterized protein n=1 Tax=Sulfurihydrogenibium yellowstonense SS-5 TaxID=432331 RepID=C4FLX9_9AQUI|nr:hypothetical protein SULYE_1583 [Sulfurihydrogenibium yellowstonense SS-5]